MTQDIDHSSRGALDASRDNGNGYAGSRVRALADSTARRGSDDGDSSARRPGVRTRVVDRPGRQTMSVAQPAAGWLGGGMQMLQSRSLRSIVAATAAGVIVGLIVFTILNSRRR